MPVSLPLRMIPATAPRVPCAGFLPGSDIAAWLEEMARHAGMKFFIVPGSAEDLEPGGLLLMPATGGHAPVQFGPRVQPASVEHGCVAVPLAMQLDPQLAPEEARRLLQYDCYFFHPSIGLIAFEESDAILPGILVVPPLPRVTSWMHAVPGRTPLPQLQHITLALSEELSGLFGEASEDIGSSDPKDLQRDSGKGAWVKDTLGNAIGSFGSWIMSGISKLGGSGEGDGKNAGSSASSGSGDKAGRGGKSGSGLWNKFQTWSAEQLAKLQRQREGAIQRLLNMLESDPDKGLRYALPLGGGEGGRGIAPPSGSLSERNPVFGARGGGRAADFWNLSADTQWKLRQKYLDLANRELATGNFDRAAYIFAHLLGDWHAAAGALVRGKRFQEAARIYEEKLNNKSLAAKCLEDGGLLAEAVLLYADLQRHEKCGDLLRLLGREHDAVEAYRRALSGSSDRLHDARILYEKLNQPGLAIAVLASGWPGTNQARLCLETHFEYLHRMGAHDDALALAVRLDDTRHHFRPPLEMVRALHTIREKQTDPRVRERLGSVTVTSIGHALKACAPGEAHGLAVVLQKMELSDLLLRRDAIRYAEGRFQESRIPKRSSLPSKSLVALEVVHQWPLEKNVGIIWNRLLTVGDSWLARGAHLSSQQEVWMLGTRDTLVGKLSPGTSWPSESKLQPHLLRGATAWLPFSKAEQVCYGSARLEDFRQPPSNRDSLISRLAWMPPAVMALYPTQDGVWILHQREQGTIDLSHATQEGKLRRTYALGISQGELPETSHMVAHGEHVWIAADSILLYVKQGKAVEQMDLLVPITRLVVSPTTHAPAVLASTSQGVKLVTLGDGLEQTTLGDEAVSVQIGAFFGDGRILVGNIRGARIYAGVSDLKEIGCINQSTQMWDFAPWSADSMAVLGKDSEVRIYR